MELISGIMESLGLDWVEVLTIILGAAFAYAKTKNYNLKKHLDAVVVYARGAATAIEVAGSGEAKEIVKKVIKQNVEAIPEIVEVNNAIMNTVDPKSNVPPIKRFWRRAIRGQNVVGLLGKFALSAAKTAAVNKIETIIDPED